MARQAVAMQQPAVAHTHFLPAGHSGTHCGCTHSTGEGTARRHHKTVHTLCKAFRLRDMLGKKPLSPPVWEESSHITCAPRRCITHSLPAWACPPHTHTHTLYAFSPLPSTNNTLLMQQQSRVVCRLPVRLALDGSRR